MSIDFRIPELETERLHMRLPRLDDLDALIAFQSSERSKFVGGPFDAYHSFHYLSAVIGQWHLRGYGRWMVTDKITGERYGLVGVYYPNDWPEPEIGWTVFTHGEGKGIAYEAALATRDYVYNTLGWTRIISLILPDNQRSIQLAKRMGCTKEVDFDHFELGQMNIWLHPGPEALS